MYIVEESEEETRVDESVYTLGESEEETYQDHEISFHALSRVPIFNSMRVKERLS
jgi:hypothetical protein